jgi:hypothetical protein
MNEFTFEVICSLTFEQHNVLGPGHLVERIPDGRNAVQPSSPDEAASWNLPKPDKCWPIGQKVEGIAQNG